MIWFLEQAAVISKFDQLNLNPVAVSFIEIPTFYLTQGIYRRGVSRND